jgi:hypothetical protein
MRLVGVMYNAIPSATPADLDARRPTSIAHWHEHVYLFAGDDPKTIRGGDDHGSMDVHMHHPPK